MEFGYNLVFSGRTIYNEIDVSNDAGIIGIGTIAGCRARFSRDIFNRDFLVTVLKKDSKWEIKCEVGVYIDKDGMKLSNICIQQGDFIPICAYDDGTELFKLTCLINYNENGQNFDARVDLRGFQQMTIGVLPDCNLRLLDITESNENIKLDNAGGYLRLSITNTDLGVYVNGNRVVGITKIKNHDFISLGPYSFYFYEADLYCSKSDRIYFKGVSVEKVLESKSALEYPKFNRNTRIKEVLSHEPITILDPPGIPQKPTDSLLMTLFPSLAMLVLIIVLRGVLSSTGGMYVIFSVCSMTLGIVTSVINFRKSKKAFKDSIKEREDTYKAYIERKQEEIDNARRIELNKLIEQYPDQSVTLSRVFDFSGDLFDRTLRDDDFLHIRVGKGDRKAARVVEYKVKDSLVLGDELQLIPEKLATDLLTLKDAPVVVDLKETGILGVVGRRELTDELLKVFVQDLCCRQYYNDASMFLICSQEQAKNLEWVRFIPHFQKETGLARNVACDKDSCDMQYEYLFNILSFRESAKERRSKFPAIIVFVTSQMGIYSHPVSKYMDRAKELGVFFVFLVESREELPLYCGNIIETTSQGNARLFDTSDKSEFVDFHYDSISDDTMWKMALKLSPIYCEDVSIEGNLPKNFSLFALLGIKGADDLDLAARWGGSDVTKSMAAPLGVKAGGEIIYLDLHERHHGPHGLVAGTTGSGKSEILQSYVLSMATLYSPEEVGFVIIDFKGGGMANLFSELPHLIGAITDIDGKAINRSLMSIRAEIDKRKKWFAEADVNNIGDYIMKYKSCNDGSMMPLPHLILIIDEFAELKADQPDFMKEVISAARVGRSLGIHLILATQKPSGVIDDQIWSNSRFKLCLKVQSQSDSNEVLKSPLAAEIREPGRAYLQIGNNEIFELFQSAYSGSPAKSEEMDHVTDFSMFEVDSCGRRSLVFSQKARRAEENDGKMRTQLDVLTEKIAKYCKDNGIHKLPSICLPPLSEKIDYPESVKTELNDFNFPVGIYDDPENQLQDEIVVSLNAANILLIGSVQTGKTNFLQLIMRTAGKCFTPEEINIYIMDFASMTLKLFERMNHVGGVVIPGEDEKLKNLFKLLKRALEERKAKLLSAGVSSFSAYLQAGYTDYPRIIVILDNFALFKEIYEETYEADFQFLTREGPTYGISFVVTNTRTAGFGYKYMSNFSTRIAFTCNESTEYVNLFDRCRTEPENLPGRILFKENNAIYEAQTFMAFEGDKEVERAASVREYIKSLNDQYGDRHARMIPDIPEVLNIDYLLQNYPMPTKKYVYPLGLDYSTIDLVELDATLLGELCIVGRDSLRREKVLSGILSVIEYRMIECKVQMYILDSFARPLKKWSDHPYTDKYTVDCDSFLDVLSDCRDELEKRQEWLRNEEVELLEMAPLLLFVINNEMVIDTISESKEITELYQEVIKLGKALKVLFIFSAVDDVASGFNSPSFVKRIRENRKAVLVDKLAEVKLFDIPISTVKSMKTAKDTDVYYLNGNDVTRIKSID